MAMLSSSASVKVVGANGQISLGKQFAGRQVLVEEREPGVWVVRTATVIPNDELWLHQTKAADDLRSAVSWAITNLASDEGADSLLEQLRNET